jgi:hypothetical protein
MKKNLIFRFGHHDKRCNKSYACLIWPTSDQACVLQSIHIYFWIWWLNMQTLYVLRANSGIMSLIENYPACQEKFWYSTYPAWWEKIVMTHVLLVYPT